MPNLVAKLLLIALTGYFIQRAVVTVRERGDAQPDLRPQFMGMLLPAIVMLLVLSANGLVTVGRVFIEHEYSPLPEPPSRAALVIDQLAALASVAGLMEIVRRALLIAVAPGREPRSAGLRAQVFMYRHLFARYALAALGLGGLYGFAAGPGNALLLAVELGSMWAVSALLVRRLERRDATQSAEGARPGPGPSDHPEP